MSPLYAWERSTWDRHPFRAAADIAGTPLGFLSLPLLTRPLLADHGHRRWYRHTPTIHHRRRRPHRHAHTRHTSTANWKLNSRQRARRACSQLRGARGTKLNDRGVFRLLR